MNYQWFAVLALLLALVGCGVQGPNGPSYQRGQTSSARSVVYLYRPYSLVGVVLLIPVHCGDDSVALKPGAYHKFTVDPGQLDCSTTTGGKSAIDIDAKAGQTYFIRQSILTWFVLVPDTYLALKTAEEAQTEIEQCREQ
jgi:hypothetical protein